MINRTGYLKAGIMIGMKHQIIPGSRMNNTYQNAKMMLNTLGSRDIFLGSATIVLCLNQALTVSLRNRNLEPSTYNC
jgi:hypothetical protein